MDKNQQALVTLLSAAIRDKYNIKIKNNDINLRAIYQEARSHEVHSLLYPLVKTLYVQQEADQELLSEWRKMSIISGMLQFQHITQMKKVFSEFNALGVQVVALKGLVLRRLYPHPELRSMGDADILIHKEDIARSKQLLILLGYIEASSDSIHSQFHHEKHLSIELHWALVNEAHIKTAADFQEKIWENTVPINISNETVLALSPESQLMHLCLHMAVHFLSSGFGLRQLCDLVLVIESEKDSINWNQFYDNCKLNGIDTFVVAIFTVCKQLFGIELPNTQYFSSPDDSYFINMLINDIFSAGVHGKKDIARVNSTSILRLQNREYSGTPKNKFLLGLSFLFPPPKKLDMRYSYAKKVFFLTPIAWIHRFIYNSFRKDFNMFKKTLTFSSSISITQNRCEIIRWLNLE